MLSHHSIVSVKTGYLPNLKERKIGGYSRSKDTRKGDRHKLDFKTRYWVRFLEQENYHLTPLGREFKDIKSGGRRLPYLSLRIRNKNLFFLKKRDTKPYYLEQQKDFLFCHLFWREKKELERILKERPYQFRKKWRELKQKTEILSQWSHPSRLVPGYRENGRPKPTGEAAGWNELDYWDLKNRSLAALAFTHDIVLGKVDAPLLDLDPNKKDKDGNYKIKQEWLRKSLEVGGKKHKEFIRKHQIPYYWTTGTPGNSLLPIPYWLIGQMKGGKVYHQDTHTLVGDLLGVGDLVALPVGTDKNRQLVITEWGRKLVKEHGTEGIFKKSLLTGKIEERVEEFLNSAFLTLDKWGVKKSKPSKYQRLVSEKKNLRPPLLSNLRPPVKEQKEPRKSIVGIRVSEKQKTPLKDIWKVYAKDKCQQPVSFLINKYQREQAFDSLNIGNALNVCLLQGYKHQFLSRILDCN